MTRFTDQSTDPRADVFDRGLLSDRLTRDLDLRDRFVTMTANVLHGDYTIPRDIGPMACHRLYLQSVQDTARIVVNTCRALGA